MVISAKKMGLFAGLFFISLCTAYGQSMDTIASQDYVPLNDYEQLQATEQKVLFPTKEAIQASMTLQKETLHQQTVDSEVLSDNSSTEFSIGKIKEHRLPTNHPLAPFFIISQNKSSLTWVEKNKEYLKSIHAVGLIIDCTNPETITHFEKQWGLPIVPANLAGASSIMGEKHYPVLVANHWVTQ